MRLAMREHVDISSGIEEEIDVTFEANAVAFYAQISGLARDKIAYPIRELSTNAWDASRGKFEVQLPTNINPILRIRDFGPGMSPEIMRTVYARLYASTKRDTNDEVGGWGLGSKSPFAYLLGDDGTGIYNVTSYHEGMMRAYTMSLAQDGKPKLRLLLEAPSEEPSGMEISFAVRRDDIWAFNNKANQILWGFTPRPKVTPAIAWAEPTVLASGDGWTMYRNGSVPFSGPNVRMGPVMYPFDLNMIEGHQFIAGNETILFDAEIGSLSVTLSREALSYDERTKASLKALIAKYEKSVIDQLQTKVSNAPNFLGACAIFAKETSDLTRAKSSFLRGKVKWRNRELISELTRPDAKFMVLAKDWTPLERFYGDTPDVRVLNSDMKIVVEHNPSYSFLRMREAGLIGKPLLWARVKRDDLDAVIEYLGNPTYEVLDDTKLTFKSADGEKRPKTMRRRRNYRIGKGKMGSYSMPLLRTDDVDLAEGGYFIRRYKGRSGNVIINGRATYESNASSLISTAYELDILKDDIQLLVATPDEELNENWIDLMDEILKAMKAMYDPKKVDVMHGKNIYNMSQSLRSFADNRTSFAKAPVDVKDLAQRAKALLGTLRTNTSKNPQNDLIKAFLDQHRIEVKHTAIDEACPIQTMEEEYAALNKKYPLLNIIRNSSSWGVQGLLDHYFDLLACQQREAEVEASKEQVFSKSYEFNSSEV